MTRIIFPVLLAAIALLVTCSNDQNTIQPDSPSATQELTDVLVEGTWVITLFIDDGDDDTDYFEGYTFSFQPGGDVVATSSQTGQDIQGTWQVRSDDGRAELWLNFSTGDYEFRELNEDWYLIEASADRIRLEYDYDDDDDIYLLTFERL